MERDQYTKDDRFESIVRDIQSELDLSDELVETAENIYYDEAKDLFSGKSATIAATCVYASSLICNEKVTQRQVAEASRTVVKTVANRFNKLSSETELHKYRLD